jgi:hypothetical protein
MLPPTVLSLLGTRFRVPELFIYLYLVCFVPRCCFVFMLINSLSPRTLYFLLTLAFPLTNFDLGIYNLLDRPQCMKGLGCTAIR